MSEMENQTPSERFVSVREAAQIHGVTVGAIETALSKKKLKFQRINGKRAISIADLAEYKKNLYSHDKSTYKGELIFDNHKVFYSVAQTAKMLGVLPQKIYYAIYAKTLKGVKKGSTYVLHIDDINEYKRKSKNNLKKDFL